MPASKALLKPINKTLLVGFVECFNALPVDGKNILEVNTMDFKITDTGDYKVVHLCAWNGSGYGPNVFQDLETSFPATHKLEDGGCAYLCTAAEYARMFDWWKEEVRCMNAREEGQEGTDYSGMLDEMEIWDETIRNHEYRVSRYSYSKLLSDALETGTHEALAALAEWCEQYGNCWNGECWGIDDGRSLFPVYSNPDEDGDCDIIGYEIR